MSLHERYRWAVPQGNGSQTTGSVGNRFEQFFYHHKCSF